MKYQIQALKAEKVANYAGYIEHHPDWFVLRESDDAAELLNDFVNDINDDFSEFVGQDITVHDFYLRLTQAGTSNFPI